MIDINQPLWMPQGSVRAILALGVVGAYVAGLVEQDVAMLVLGVYFGARIAGAQSSTEVNDI